MIYVGIDIASEKHDYFMIQQETGVVFSRSAITIPNSEVGYKKLHADISAFCGATDDSKVRIGLESTGIYHTNIIHLRLTWTSFARIFSAFPVLVILPPG